MSAKKYSEFFWNLANRSCELCQLISLPHETVIRKAADLDPVNGFVKPRFAVIEFGHFVIIAFRDELDYSKNPSHDELVALRHECRRLIEKLNLKTPKPVYYTGQGQAGITAIYAATKDGVSGIFTFGLPEKIYAKREIKSAYPMEAVYNFQLAGEEDKADEFSSRIVIDKKFIQAKDLEASGIERFVEPLNKAILAGWVPLEPLDDILSALTGQKPPPSKVMALADHREFPTERLKSPLKIVLFHHPADSARAQSYIDNFRVVFDGFAPKEKGYLGGFSGIPGALRVISKPPCDLDEKEIRDYFDDTLHTIVVVLTDHQLARSATHMNWLEKVAKVINTDRTHRLLPIGLNDTVFDETQDYEYFSKIQRAECCQLGEKAVQSSYAALLTVHLAYDLLSIPLPGDNRLTIFLSHSKQDGLPLAQAFEAQLGQLPADLKNCSFFDTKSLEPGIPWDQQLRDHSGSCSMLLVLRTKSYDSRPWCREEFLTAVKEDVPIIVVDARDEAPILTFAESATDSQRKDVLPFNRYPVTTVNDGNLIRVVGLVLAEGLRQLTFERDAHQIRQMEGFPSDATEVFHLNSGVEGLMKICEELEKKSPPSVVVIHQEPELRDIQHRAYERIVKSFFPDSILRTCSGCIDKPSSADKRMDTILADHRIGISIAAVEGLLQEEAANHLTLHAVERLFSHGGSVAFGHDWRAGGIMEAVYDCMKRSFPPPSRDGEKVSRILNMVPWRNGKAFSETKELESNLKYLSIETVELPDFVSDDSDQMLGLNAIALTEMREKLTKKCQARICIGGKTANTTGAMSGILEEAALAIEQNQPLYLCGHWGGATEAICKILLGEKEISPADFAPQEEVTEQLKSLKEKFGEEVVTGPEDAFNTIKECSLRKLSDLNGLSKEDNLELFRTSDIRHAMTLILKGLKARCV